MVLELWGGLECSVARLEHRYSDQVERSGHASRLTDLDRIAELGIKTVRYPVLWERVAPRGLAHADWSWSDERLGRLRELGIRPIVGLLHHGSGPRDTSLVDPAFPEKLARYARAVAERYPWVDAYTPVNEPLTTARFSGLYGHWYPHGRENATFARALINECRATVLAMRAIQSVNPSAQLVQTEDLGKTFSTPALEYQAEFENERRWVTFDLLSGRLGRDRRMWQFLEWCGIPAKELELFVAEPHVPGVVGVNYYMTSERFLDDRVGGYPAELHGGNGRDRYADVEAVRVRRAGLAGPRELLREAWERYRLPVAVTEAHLGCTREEQLRWFASLWRDARGLREDGVDIRAVTAWALFGVYDWDSLLTRETGSYEPGAFDVRSPEPRATALARVVRHVASGNEPEHPVLQAPGWWERPERLLYRAPHGIAQRHAASPPSRAQPLLITGGRGTLGTAVARACDQRGLPYWLLRREHLDIADATAVRAALLAFRPWAVVNAGGYVRVEDAEDDIAACMRANADGAAVLAEACADRGTQLVTFSTDLVFDGAKERPYVESDPVRPLSVYGRSKAEAETRVLATLPSALVIRTSAFFGPWDRHNFVTLALDALTAGGVFAAADDVVVSPTYVPDLAQAALDLLVDAERGIWHLSNDVPVTWIELARLAAAAAGVDAGAIEARPSRELWGRAPRPAYSALTSERGRLMPSLESALARYVAARPARALIAELGDLELAS